MKKIIEVDFKKKKKKEKSKVLVVRNLSFLVCREIRSFLTARNYGKAPYLKMSSEEDIYEVRVFILLINFLALKLVLKSQKKRI